jgi:hypothetical protein
MLLLSLMLACGGDKADDSQDTGETPIADSGTSTDSGTPTDSGDTEDTFPPDTQDAVRLTGQATWTLIFDEEAEANGFFDCSYSRSFEGLQYLDQPYLCADCEVQTGGTATMTEGEDCFAQISSAGPVRYEAWGFSQEGFFRSSPENQRLGELSEITLAEEGGETPIGWVSDYDITEGGTMNLAAEGSFSWSVDPETQLEIPGSGHSGPYTCGWPQNDPGDLELDYTLADGSVFPNVHLRDQCGEQLSIWDLYGRYLIFDNTQPDCAPCRNMAESAEAFVDQMAGQGVEVMMVSLMGNGLSEPWVEPSEEMVDAWVDAYGIEDPVLADRGFGYGLMPPYFDFDYGFPAWMIVAPDMTLIVGNVGFTSWDPMESIILEHAGQ